MGILIPLADRVWVLPGGVNIGVLANDDGQIVLVDTGLNESSAKKALKAVREELGGEVVAVLTTHAHADHFGGNATIVKRTGAVIHAPKFDEAFLRYPLLQPASLFGGADPLDTLRGNFLLADASPVDAIVEPGAHEIAGIRLEAVALYGHSPGQLGYLAGDVFFCADVVLPANVLDKYRIPYLFSLTEHLAALERARCTPHRVAVAGHGPILEDGAARRGNRPERGAGPARRRGNTRADGDAAIRRSHSRGNLAAVRRTGCRRALVLPAAADGVRVSQPPPPVRRDWTRDSRWAVALDSYLSAAATLVRWVIVDI